MSIHQAVERGRAIDLTPKALPDGKFAARAVVTREADCHVPWPGLRRARAPASRSALGLSTKCTPLARAICPSRFPERRVSPEQQTFSARLKGNWKRYRHTDQVGELTIDR